MSDEGLNLLRGLLTRAEQRAHTARPRHKPLRWRRRRETHRNYMHFTHDRQGCR